MPNRLFTAHNPSTVWQVPDTFRAIYSHATEIVTPGRVLFISGQFGVAPDGKLPAEFAAQCEQAMDNVEALLAAAGMAAANIIRLTYYVTRAADFPALVQVRPAPLGVRSSAFGDGARGLCIGPTGVSDRD